MALITPLSKNSALNFLPPKLYNQPTPQKPIAQLRHAPTFSGYFRENCRYHFLLLALVAHLLIKINHRLLSPSKSPAPKQQTISQVEQNHPSKPHQN